MGATLAKVFSVTVSQPFVNVNELRKRLFRMTLVSGRAV
jgi:hypothetical protein